MENSQSSNEIQNLIMSCTSLSNLDSNTIEENNQPNEKPKKNQIPKIDKLYRSLFELYSQKQFKKIVKTVKLKSDRIGKFFFSEWKLLHLRMFALQTILDDKMSKYHNANKIPHFSNYIKEINNDINNWIILSTELFDKGDENYYKSFIEFIITFILKNCIILSKKFIHFGFIKDALIALSLGIRLINHSITYFSSPDSYFLSAEIFLFFSSFMLAEKNYKTAMNLISLSIKFNFLSLELKLSKNANNYQTIFNLNNYGNEMKILTKIFFNLSTAFYQLSICFEHYNDSYRAYFAIKTSNYFAKYSNLKNISLFQDLIHKIETRLLMRNRIIIFFEKCVRKEDLEDKIIKKKSAFKIMVSHEEKKQKKFQNLSNFLEKIKIVEIDDDEPDLFNRVGDKQIKQNTLKMIKHIQLLNYLMNDEFKDLVNSMQKIEINKPDKETINKISKKIINVKNKEHFKLENKLKKQFSIKKKIEERKNSTVIEKNDKEESYEKMQKNKNQNKYANKNNMNKSNTFKSTTALSLSTTNKKNKTRVHSAFQRVNQKYLIQDINRKNTSKVLTNRNTSQKTNFSNISMYCIPSAYLSLRENNILNQKNKSNNFLIHSSGMQTSNSIHLKLNYDSINYPLTKKHKKKNSFKLNLKLTTPKYNHDKLALAKGFRKKYSFLANQFDKEIDFHKNLLRTKSLKEELVKPKSPNFKELNEKFKNFFYTTYYKELMNAKEKQIIFDKKDVNKKNKLKIARRFQSPEFNIFKKLNLSNDVCLDTEEVKEINNKYINKMSKYILEINEKKDLIQIMKKY